MGCSSSVSYHKVYMDAAAVKKEDGISEKESVILAKKFIISKGMASRLYSLEPIAVHQRVLWNKNGEKIEFDVFPDKNFALDLERRYEVLFKDKEGSLLAGAYPVIPFYVDVDEKTGAILEWGLKK